MRDRLGRYEIREHLAQGGMGELYVGRGDGDDFDVVLKCVQARGDDDPRHSRTRMFLDEARVTTLIRHENVVRVHEVNYEDGVYYLVMEKLEGWDLADVGDRLSQSDDTLPVEIVAHLITRACLGLHAAHECTTERGEPLHLVHRDVSPGNLFITVDGALKVLDFGIAKTSIQVAKTRIGYVKGKFSYMSPEQARGRTLDRRSDIFSLGIVLHEFLRGRRLFTRDTPHDTMNAILHDVVVPPARADGSVGGDLMAVTMRALSREPELRFASAAEMAEALSTAVPDAQGVRPGDVAATLAGLFDGSRAPQVAATVASSAPHALRQWAETVTARLRNSEDEDDIDEDETIADSLPETIEEEVVSAEETVADAPAPVEAAETVADGALQAVADETLLGDEEDETLADHPPTPFESTEDTAADTIPGTTTDVDANRAAAGGPAPLEMLASVGSVTVREVRRHWPTAAIVAGFAALTLVLVLAAWPDPPPPTRAVPPPPPPSSASTAPASPDPRPLRPRKAAAARAKATKARSAKPGAARARAKSKRPVRATGRLTLDAKPWANVYLQNRLLGPTPLVEQTLPAGRVELRLVNPQLGIEKTVSVDIPANELLRTTIRLQP